MSKRIVNFRDLKNKVPYIEPIESNLSLEILTKDQLQQIHEATMTVLEEVGVHFPFQDALDIFEQAGAEIDSKEDVVRLPQDIVEQALDNAPSKFKMAGRDPELDVEIDIDKPETYFRPGGSGTTTIDFETREERASTGDDVGKAALISDYLPIISFYWPFVSAQDRERELAPLYELVQSFSNTKKHVQTETTMGKKLAEYAIEMGKAIAGGEDALRERPVISCLICTVQPLAQDKEGLEAGLAYAEAGVPIGFMSMPTTGLSAPATPAGALVIANAEILSAITLIQLAHPGAPVFYSISSANVDPRNGGFSYGSTSIELINSACPQLAHFYDIPANPSGDWGGGNYRINTAQVGRERIYQALLSVMSGAEIGSSLGVVGGTHFFPERILFDNDIFQAVKQIVGGVEVDADTLALDVIENVGQRGNFLPQTHTIEHLPDLWPPSISHELLEETENENIQYRDAQEVGIEEIKWILNNHKPKPLEEGVRKELDRILSEARGDLLN